MSSFLCLTVRFLDPVPRFHGRGDNGDPEWPPSPLRLYQALVCAAATRWRGQAFLDYARPALQWLEAVQPAIVTPRVPTSSFGYRMYVPNNSGDLMTAAWARGDTEKSMAEYRVEKDVRPTHMNGEAVHFLFPIAEGDDAFAKHHETLRAAARSVTHLGWGVDLVAGDAALISAEQAVKLAGECWRPVNDAGATQLRVPQSGTLQALLEKHVAFLKRLSSEGFKPVPPLTTFDRVGYRRDTDTAFKPWVVFELRTPDFARFQPFDTTRRTPDVAGMVRNATFTLANEMRPFGWSDEQILMFVHGHTADGQDRAHGANAEQRFSYLPLPSLEQRPAGVHVGSIRRVLLTAPVECRKEILWSRVLSGQELSPIGDTPPAALRLINCPPSSVGNDANLRHYLGESRIWSTVTPVVLPGHDDPDGIRRRLRERDPDRAMGDEKPGQLAALNRRTERLLRKAFRHAGFPEGVANSVQLEWRNVGFRAGVDLATRYQLAASMKGPRFHVRVTFQNPVRGPLAVGAGRYRGLGLFAAE